MRSMAVALAAGLALPGGPVPAHAAEGPSATVSTEGGTATVRGGEAVKAAVQAYVAEHARGGVYRLADGGAGAPVDLEFVSVGVVSSGALWRVHDPGRKVEEGASLACARFHPVGTPDGQLYDLDFLLERREGGLVVSDVKLHKVTRLVDGKWIWEEARAKAGPERRSTGR